MSEGGSPRVAHGVSRGKWRFFKALRAARGSGGEFPESFLRKIFENREIVFFTIKQCCLAYFLWFYALLLEYFCNFDDIFFVGRLFLLLTFANGGGVC
ncbi:hypothetical protein ACLD6A_03390 [Gardnerella sp. Marseille-Q9691]|uniref:hypothetical protein n=1 Tax=Gardnerella sp. Marseille-Q9691 TaxID=3390096 RepID=UPI003970D946